MKRLIPILCLSTLALADHHKEAEPCKASTKTDTSLPAELPATSDSDALKKAGFKALFNEKDLSGWKKVGGNAEFEVKERAIRGFGKNINRNTFLRTEEEFGDFVATFQIKFIDKNGNSGCMFRGLQKDGKPDGLVMGYQCEHDNFKDENYRGGKRSFTAGIFDESRRGWLAPNKNASKEEKEAFTAQGEKLFKWDDWNTIVIRCQGNRLQTWLNGEARTDFTDTDDKHTTLKGFLGFQVHGGASGDIMWKNIYLKEIE